MKELGKQTIVAHCYSDMPKHNRVKSDMRRAGQNIFLTYWLLPSRLLRNEYVKRKRFKIYAIIVNFVASFEEIN